MTGPENQMFLIERSRAGSLPTSVEEVDRMVARAKQILTELLNEGLTVYEIWSIGTLIAESNRWLVKLGRQETND